jgi:hypothetical protein
VRANGLFARAASCSSKQSVSRSRKPGLFASKSRPATICSHTPLFTGVGGITRTVSTPAGAFEAISLFGRQPLEHLGHPWRALPTAIGDYQYLCT